jgi:hypothetical protein
MIERYGIDFKYRKQQDLGDIPTEVLVGEDGRWLICTGPILSDLSRFNAWPT